MGFIPIHLPVRYHQQLYADVFRESFYGKQRGEIQGLVPCEASALKAKLLISDIPVHKEIIGDAASYFSLMHPEDFKAQMTKALDQNAPNQVPNYISRPSTVSWKNLVQQFS